MKQPKTELEANVALIRQSQLKLIDKVDRIESDVSTIKDKGLHSKSPYLHNPKQNWQNGTRLQGSAKRKGGEA